MLLARYCKLFGLEPADQFALSERETAMRVAINWACYIAYAQSENEEYQKAQAKSQDEAFAMGKFLDELKEASTSRG